VSAWWASAVGKQSVVDAGDRMAVRRLWSVTR
jgi:hypothetical protein